MARLFFDPEPDAELTKVEGNPDLYARVHGPLRERLGWLRDDHRHPRTHQTTFSNGLHYIFVPVDGEPDWAILWEEISPVDDEPAVAIRYLGLDFR